MIDLSKAIELAQNYIDNHLHQDNQYIICEDEIWLIFVDYNGVCFGMWRPFRLGGRKPIK
nr:hypothetical protein [uncultured Kingella sp.]